MSHAISAFIARQPAMASLSAALGNAPFFSIRNDGLFFLPVTDEIFDHATTLKGDSDPVAEGYYRFSGSLAAIACACSTEGPIAHVFTDYFGGDGTQGAMTWKAGAISMKPQVSRLGPINAALRTLGVQATPPQDEFDAAGLDKVRDNDRFESFAPPAPTPAPSVTWLQRLANWLRPKP